MLRMKPILPQIFSTKHRWTAVTEILAPTFWILQILVDIVFLQPCLDSSKYYCVRSQTMSTKFYDSLEFLVTTNCLLRQHSETKLLILWSQHLRGSIIFIISRPMLCWIKRCQHIYTNKELIHEFGTEHQTQHTFAFGKCINLAY